MEFLEKPYTLEEMKEKADEMGYISGNVSVGLYDIANADFETFLGILAEKLTGSVCLLDICAYPVGVKDDQVIICVSGNVAEIIRD